MTQQTLLTFLVLQVSDCRRSSKRIKLEVEGLRAHFSRNIGQKDRLQRVGETGSLPRSPPSRNISVRCHVALLSVSLVLVILTLAFCHRSARTIDIPRVVTSMSRLPQPRRWRISRPRGHPRHVKRASTLPF